jgi:hypothetical protein
MVRVYDGGVNQKWQVFSVLMLVYRGILSSGSFRVYDLLGFA